MVDPVADDWNEVSSRVLIEMAKRGWVPNDVYRVANVDPKTLEKVLMAQKIRNDSARRLARAFGWREDGLMRIAQGLEPVEVDTDDKEVDARLSAIEADLAEVRQAVQQLLDREADAP